MKTLDASITIIFSPKNCGNSLRVVSRKVTQH